LAPAFDVIDRCLGVGFLGDVGVCQGVEGVKGAGVHAATPHCAARARMPAPDLGLRIECAPHDLKSAVTVRCRQHDLGTPDELARSVAVGDQSLKLSTVGGAKVKANIIASHAPNMAHQALNGNPVSGGEH
jgi:hypothetical protein